MTNGVRELGGIACRSSWTAGAGCCPAAKAAPGPGLPLTLGLFAALLVGLALAGACQSFTPVPCGDMWPGTLEFFMRVRAGDHAAWWSQHNEHRIVLARLLFWTDFRWFGGSGRFLIFSNCLLAGAGAFLFWRILRAAVASAQPGPGETALGLFITAWLFQWMQNENLTWAFQSQFFLAQLLPLAALYWLYKSAGGINSGRDFGIAVVLGLASVGTMANGIMALPLLTACALLMRQAPWRIGVLAGLAALAVFFYVHDYQTVSQHGSLARAMRENPAGLLQYTLLYLGGPFYYLAGQGAIAKNIALAAGLALVAGASWFAGKTLRQSRADALTVALLGFILYIVGTALGTAGGRLILGVDQALSSRYTTPALMAWATLLLLSAPRILAALNSGNRKCLLSFALLGGTMAYQQAAALQAPAEMLFARKIAALALALQVRDQRQVVSVYPDVDYALQVAGQASALKLSVFGGYPLREVGAQLGEAVRRETAAPGQGCLEEVESIDGDTRFVRVRGWMASLTGATFPELIRFLDGQGRVAGFALTGQARPDVAAAIGPGAGQSGFQGYLLAGQMGAVITMQGDSYQLRATVPVSLFSVVAVSPSADLATRDNADILPGNQWLGADYDRSIIPGLRIYGSSIDADYDVGSITLRLKRGDRIFYRSGPTGGRQVLEIAGTALPRVKLPVATGWVLLDFSSPILPEGEFIARFSDNGADWGAWSAVALRQAAGCRLTML